MKKEVREGDGKAGERDWRQKGGMGLSLLKCGCLQALSTVYIPDLGYCVNCLGPCLPYYLLHFALFVSSSFHASLTFTVFIKKTIEH